MGQGQSQQVDAPMSEWDPSISPEERMQAQADLRAKQQAALAKRIAPKRKTTPTATRTVETTRASNVPRQLRQEEELSTTPESVSEVESDAEPMPALTPKEQDQAQADLRAKQQAALDKRFATKQKKPSTTNVREGAQARKKPTALEQASRENVGYRNMDSQREYVSWN